MKDKDIIYKCVKCETEIKNFDRVFVIHKLKPYCYECYYYVLREYKGE